VLALALFLPVGAQNCVTQYTVKAGDNLYRIGLAHNVPFTQIAAANNLANPNLIFVGNEACKRPPAPRQAIATTRRTSPRDRKKGEGRHVAPRRNYLLDGWARPDRGRILGRPIDANPFSNPSSRLKPKLCVNWESL
jgi:hypothetical protein